MKGFLSSSLVGSWGLLCRFKRLLSCLGSVGYPSRPSSQKFFLTVHYFNSFVPIAQQAGQAVVLGRLSLSICPWTPVSARSVSLGSTFKFITCSALKWKSRENNNFCNVFVFYFKLFCSKHVLVLFDDKLRLASMKLLFCKFFWRARVCWPIPCHASTGNCDKKLFLSVDNKYCDGSTS